MIHRLQRIVQEVNRAPDIDRALVLITESLTRDLCADACTIFLAKKDDPEVMMLQACSGLKRFSNLVRIGFNEFRVQHCQKRVNLIVLIA